MRIEGSVHRLAAYLLSACFVFVGTGALKHLHNLSHVQPQAVAAAEQQSPAPQPQQTPPVPIQHERDCLLHLMLGAPLLDQAGSTAIVREGAAEWAPPMTQGEPADSRLPSRVDCRGPPLC